MKTNTRLQIIEIIKQNRNSRPIEIYQRLKLSPQAIHRHLKKLLSDGVIEVAGAGPHTRYSILGVPNLANISEWIRSKDASNLKFEYVSETRDAFTARLSSLKVFTRDGLSSDLLPLVISAVGEVGNNTFDHNLGQWRDVPGCWFEAQVTGKKLWVCIADRGQGIFRSLSRAHPSLKNEDAAIKAAFEEIISGRAPEQRGNGLKYVRKIITEKEKCGLACISGSASIRYGELGIKCEENLKTHFKNVAGTITLLVWSL